MSKREAVLKLRVSESDLELWRHGAELAGLKLSEWVRRKCNGERIGTLLSPQTELGLRGTLTADYADSPQWVLLDPVSEGRDAAPELAAPEKTVAAVAKPKAGHKGREPGRTGRQTRCPHGFTKVDGVTACPKCR